MTSAVLVENGPWQRLNVASPPPIGGHNNIERHITHTNNNLLKSLGLRQNPIELRESRGEWEVRIRGVAGMLSTGSISLNIAPKYIPQGDIDLKWGHSLLMLISHASPKHVVFNRSPHLGSSHLNFIDLMAMAFIDAIQDGMRDQLIQTYQVQEMCLPTIRGRLNIRRQIHSTFQRPHLIECDVDQLDAINPYNNLLKWASKIFATSIHSAALRRKVVELNEKLPGIPNPLLAQRHRVVTPPPQFRAWEPALEIATLLHSGLALTNNKGGLNGYTFVFNMERLFEHFVENTLRRSLSLIPELNLRNHPQASTLYATSQSTNYRGFYSKPDNLLTQNGKKIAVVDAKYKRLSDSEGLSNKKPQSQDVYELVAAMTAHQCKIGLLLYPKVTGDVILCDGELHTWSVEAFGEELTIAAIAIDLMVLCKTGGARTIEEHLAKTLENLLS